MLPVRGRRPDNWSVRLTDRLEQDIVWNYTGPFRDGKGVRGLLCFVDDRVDVEVTDGVDPLGAAAAQRGTRTGAAAAVTAGTCASG